MFAARPSLAVMLHGGGEEGRGTREVQAASLVVVVVAGPKAREALLAVAGTGLASDEKGARMFQRGIQLDVFHDGSPAGSQAFRRLLFSTKCGMATPLASSS
ncbi:hypothetical protein VTJ04DRAFT_2552 [Mycothermus thermophilus]|uniref:uncharacterized protein n=1 Tax=Humicola insolens TaxID=85995 RepID=UPI003743BF2F